MARPVNILLQPGGVIVENYDSTEILIVSTDLMNIGIVRQVYDDFGIFSENDVVIYNKENARAFKNNSTTFWFINEQDVYFGEEIV